MKTPLRVLVVEDSPDDAELMLLELRRGGYHPRSQRVEASEAMGAALDDAQWDIILCDYAMPQFSAPAALALLKERPLDIPFIVVSGQIGEDTAVEMMRAGAHDYVMKGNLARLAPAVERELAEAEQRRKRQEAEQALRESEEQFRQLFTHMTSGVCVWEAVDDGAGFVLRDINPSGAKLCSVRREDVVDRSAADAFPGIEQFGLLEVLREVWTTGKPGFHPVAMYEDTGLVGWFENSVFKLPNGQVVAVFENVTARKRAEDEARDLAKFPAESPDPVLRVAKDGTVVFANRAAEPLLNAWNYQAGEALPQEWSQVVADVLVSGHREDVEIESDGRILLVTFAPVVEAGYVNLYARDVTRHRELEEQLRQAQKMEVIGGLAGGIAHDFRNQLTVIKGYGERLLRWLGDDDKYGQPIREILDAVDRSAMLTGHLLAFSRKEMLAPKVVRPMDLIGGLAEPLKHMLGEDVLLTTLVPDGLDNITVDPMQFEQVIANLAVNARDAMPGGGELRIEAASVEIDGDFVRRHPGASRGPHVMISVADTGAGMDAKTRQRAFEPFFTTKEVGEGTGLGLSMVYGFVKQSGGYITVDSEPGRGTTFRIYLPATTEPAEEVESRAETQPAAAAHAAGTILVVEDEEAVRKMLVETLRECGHTVMDAGSAREALPLGEHYQGEIDLLITDVVMPGVNGVELANRFKAARPGMVVIFISGYSDRKIIREGLAGGEANLLVKPFGPDELLGAVDRALDRTRDIPPRDA